MVQFHLRQPKIGDSKMAKFITKECIVKIKVEADNNEVASELISFWYDIIHANYPISLNGHDMKFDLVAQDGYTISEAVTERRNR